MYFRKKLAILVVFLSQQSRRIGALNFFMSFLRPPCTEHIADVRVADVEFVRCLIKAQYSLQG